MFNNQPVFSASWRIRPGRHGISNDEVRENSQIIISNLVPKLNLGTKEYM